MDTLAITCVVVGWADTRESRRALSDALPILERADEVLVLYVLGERERGPNGHLLEQAAHYLARHSIARERVPQSKSTVGDAVISTALNVDADLIVVGGPYVVEAAYPLG